MGLCLLSTALIYIFIPETTCLPVEEIGALFGDDVIVHLTPDGHGIVEIEKELDIIGNHDLTNRVLEDRGVSMLNNEEVKA